MRFVMIRSTEFLLWIKEIDFKFVHELFELFKPLESYVA